MLNAVMSYDASQTGCSDFQVDISQFMKHKAVINEEFNHKSG